RRQGGLVVRHARKLQRLINQLLDLSKLEAGALQLNAVPGDAATFGRRLLGAFASLADTQHVALHLQVPDQPVPLVFDPEKLEDILTNLLANALRFTPRGGQVTLAVAEEPASPAAPFGAVRFVVRDTGPGIAPAHQARLFDRFYQVENAGAAAPRTGTGLGLALVKELTSLHGGTVAVQSEPGHGAAFTVWLPRPEAGAGATEGSGNVPAADDGQLQLNGNDNGNGKVHDAAAGPSRAGAASGTVAPELVGREAVRRSEGSAADYAPVAGRRNGAAPTDPPRIAADFVPALSAEEEPLAEADVVLIIEDHPDVRQFIRESLAPAGYRLLEAPDGAAGMTLARETVPDLVLSDVMMPPGPDGYQVCAQLKTDPATSHIPVVLLTARADPRDKLQGLETGADAYLAKPFNPRELRAQVRNLLALRRRLQTRFVLLPGPQPAPNPAVSAPGAVPASALLSPLEQHAAAVAALPSLDQAFLRRVAQAVETHLDDGEFSVETLSQEVALSRAQLHRKLKALTGQAPSDFIRTTRLLRAHALLQAQVGNVAEVAYQVGFNSPAHFSSSFSKQFGYAPSEVERRG
ncbi:MAG: response regulator, partial [Hymenobacter sp.]|nr:response regulator [Hymenobacter sp.]